LKNSIFETGSVSAITYEGFCLLEPLERAYLDQWTERKIKEAYLLLGVGSGWVGVGTMQLFNPYLANVENMVSS